MKVLKFIWRLILNLILAPLLLATIAAFIAGMFSQDSNQTQENYQTSQENITRLKGDKVFAEVADPDFDGVGMAFMITYLIVFVFMIIYMIITRNDKKPAEQVQ